MHLLERLLGHARLVAGLLSVALLAALPAPGYAQARRRHLRVAVLELTAVGVARETADNLTAVLAAETARYDELRPVSRREIADLLDLDRQKKMLGCNDDSCLAEVVGALGVDKILSGQLGQLDGAWVLTLHLIDTRTGRVDGRVVRTVPADGQLIDAAKTALTELMGPQRASKNQSPRMALARHVVAREGDRVALDATRCYDPDGDPLQFRWFQTDGPPAVLESPLKPLAAFIAAETGRYLFTVEISDGRSAPLEQVVEIEVREQRLFLFGLAYKQLLSFNRMVDTDEQGNVFRNRAPFGPALLFEMRLAEGWALTGELAGSFMHVYPEDESLEAHESLDVWEASVVAGVRHRFHFPGFALTAGASMGTARLFFSARQGEREETNVRTQTLVGDLAVGADIPLGERFGLLLHGGLRARSGTDAVAPFRGIGFAVARNGFLWGVNAVAGAYFRL